VSCDLALKWGQDISHILVSLTHHNRTNIFTIQGTGGKHSQTKYYLPQFDNHKPATSSICQVYSALGPNSIIVAQEAGETKAMGRQLIP
jgi:hypothetical protein